MCGFGSALVASLDRFAALGAALCAAACAAGGSNELSGSQGSGAVGSGGDAATMASTGASLDAVSAGSGGGSSSSSGGGGTLVFLHDATTLYSLDPASPASPPKFVGTFDCISSNGPETSMTDFAVNRSGDMWGISPKVVHRLSLQGKTVHCATTTTLTSAKTIEFYALSFAPEGVLDPKNEVLVAGNTEGQLFAIDGNGNSTQHGSFGAVPANDGHGHTYKYPGVPWELSGDIVFLANNGNPVGFATVRDCPSPPSTSNCDKTDTLLQIDMKKLATATTQSVTLAVRGMVVKATSCNDPNSGYGSMFGIAAWNDKVYGFSHSGAMVLISNVDGSACLVQSSSTQKWDGAGVTTVAPVDVPPVN